MGDTADAPETVAPETVADVAEVVDASAPDGGPDGDATGVVPKCLDNKGCDDGNACTKDVCKTGACTNANQPNNVPCEDGEGCTVNDHCAAGKCVGGVVICACLVKADCAKLEDGNACNGTLYCQKTPGQPTTNECVVDPKTVVSCAKDLDSACQKNACEKTSGECGMQPVAGTNVLCEDGDPCTTNETCQGGLCKGGLDVCQCKQTADCAVNDNNDPCDGSLHCDKSKAPYLCVADPATVPPPCPTDADQMCVKNLCQATTGQCKMTNVSIQCNDGDSCTSGDQCSQGNCSYAKDDCKCALGNCDDLNPCTNDGCYGAGLCSHFMAQDGTVCGEGKVCKIGQYKDK